MSNPATETLLCEDMLKKLKIKSITANALWKFRELLR